MYFWETFQMNVIVCMESGSVRLSHRLSAVVPVTYSFPKAPVVLRSAVVWGACRSHALQPNRGFYWPGSFEVWRLSRRLVPGCAFLGRQVVRLAICTVITPNPIVIEASTVCVPEMMRCPPCVCMAGWQCWRWLAPWLATLAGWLADYRWAGSRVHVLLVKLSHVEQQGLMKRWPVHG